MPLADISDKTFEERCKYSFDQNKKNANAHNWTAASIDATESMLDEIHAMCREILKKMEGK